MNYDIILYVGIAFYVAIFITFIVYQMHDREEDRKQWLSDQLTKAFNKAKEEEKKQKGKNDTIKYKRKMHFKRFN